MFNFINQEKNMSSSSFLVKIYGLLAQLVRCHLILGVSTFRHPVGKFSLLACGTRYTKIFSLLITFSCIFKKILNNGSRFFFTIFPKNKSTYFRLHVPHKKNVLSHLIIILERKKIYISN